MLLSRPEILFRINGLYFVKYDSKYANRTKDKKIKGENLL